LIRATPSPRGHCFHDLDVDTTRVTRRAEVLQLSCLSAAVSLLGLALCFPFFSFAPLIWSVGLVAAFLLYFTVCLALRRTALPTLYLMIGLGYSAVFAGAAATFTGVTRVEQYDCNWRMDADVVEIDLSPAGGFGWARVASGELTAHLRKDRPAKVYVDVPITRDFGRVRARGMIKLVDGVRVRES
jgi:uncharacterized protein (DUF58 family)